MANTPDASKFIHPQQIGGILQYTLDNGAARGGRVCEVNTGAGLRYRVIVDRGLDIDHAFMGAHSLAFLTHNNLTAPSRAYDRDADWLKSFPGGLLTSCGPFNAGAPATDNGETLGLHGAHSNTPAEIESVLQPDFATGRRDMSITGVLRYGAFYGPNLLLRRTISSTVGEASIRIRDVFTNPGNIPLPHAWLLHINFGYPLLDEGAEFLVDDRDPQPRRDELSQAFFQSGSGGKTFPAPSDDQHGDRHVFRYLTPRAKGPTSAAIWNPKLSLGVVIDYDATQFPRLGQWMHWGRHEYVAALEPMTAGVEGRPIDRQNGWLREIAPGQSLSYDYAFRVVAQRPAVNVT